MIEYHYFEEGTQKPLVRCPGCNRDLLSLASVIIFLSVAGQELEMDSCLDTDGKLVDSDDNAVGNGYHAGAVCTGCGRYLLEMADELMEDKHG